LPDEEIHYSENWDAEKFIIEYLSQASNDHLSFIAIRPISIKPSGYI